MTFKFIWKRAIKWSLAQVRWDAVLASLIQREQHLVVLNFHRIHPQPNPFWPAIRPNDFDQLVGYLKETFRVICLADLSQTKRRASGKPQVILSFDDGYFDFVEYACPILEKHDIRANLNIIPYCVESGLSPWNGQLYEFLSVADPALIRRISIPGFEDHLRSDSPEEKARFGAALSAFLKRRPRSERLPLWEHLAGPMREVEALRTPMMNRSDVLNAMKYHDIGAHSYSHESMGYESDVYFQADVELCEQYFDTSLGAPCKYYAFPNGSYRAEQVSYLKQRGFHRALLVDEQFTRHENFALTRFTIAANSIWELRLQVVGFNGKGAYAGDRAHKLQT